MVIRPGSPNQVLMKLNEGEQRVLLICIRFGSCEVQRLTRLRLCVVQFGLYSYSRLTNRAPAARSSDFFITCMITDRIGLHSVILPLIILKFKEVNKFSSWYCYLRRHLCVVPGKTSSATANNNNNNNNNRNFICTPKLN